MFYRAISNIASLSVWQQCQVPTKLALIFRGLLGDLKLWADETLEGFGFVLKSHVLIHLILQYHWKPGCEELKDAKARRR